MTFLDIVFNFDEVHKSYVASEDNFWSSLFVEVCGSLAGGALGAWVAFKIFDRGKNAERKAEETRLNDVKEYFRILLFRLRNGLRGQISDLRLNSDGYKRDITTNPINYVWARLPIVVDITAYELLREIPKIDIYRFFISNKKDIKEERIDLYSQLALSYTSIDFLLNQLKDSYRLGKKNFLEQAAIIEDSRVSVLDVLFNYQQASVTFVKPLDPYYTEIQKVHKEFQSHKYKISPTNNIIHHFISPIMQLSIKNKNVSGAIEILDLCLNAENAAGEINKLQEDAIQLYDRTIADLERILITVNRIIQIEFGQFNDSVGGISSVPPKSPEK